MITKENNRDFINIAFVFSCVLIVILCIYIYANSSNQYALSSYPPAKEITIIDKVCIKSSTGNIESVDLPVKRPSDQSYSYKFIVPEREDGDLSYVSVNVYYTSLKITYGDELIYSNDIDVDFDSRKGSFNLVPISKKYLNKELEIQFKSNLNDDRELKIPLISIGSKAEMINYYFNKGFVKIVSGSMLLITACFLVIIALFFIRIKHPANNIIIIALFIANVGFYILLRSWIVFYYLHSSIFIHYIEYTCLIVMPLPNILLFINLFYKNDYYNPRVVLFELSVIIIFINLIVQWILTLSGISDFIYMQKITFFILMSSSLLIPLAVFTLDKEKIKNKLLITISILPMCIVICVSIAIYFLTYEFKLSIPMLLSVLFFVFIHLWLAINNYVEDVNIDYENSFYEELAYIDSLTEIYNRNAFDKEIQTIIHGEKRSENIYLFMIDMNDLKYVNDTYGHYVGDKYLQQIGIILSNIKNSFPSTKAYRYAGDEFILLAYGITKVDAEEIISLINKLCSSYQCEDSDYPLSLAIGYDYYQGDNAFVLADILVVADSNMYKNKAEYKRVKSKVKR